MRPDIVMYGESTAARHHQAAVSAHQRERPPVAGRPLVCPAAGLIQLLGDHLVLMNAHFDLS